MSHLIDERGELYIRRAFLHLEFCLVESLSEITKQFAMHLFHFKEGSEFSFMFLLAVNG